MSADNGIYIAQVPNPKHWGGYTYYVAECGAIDKVDSGDKECQDWYRWQLFGKATPLYNERQAIELAIILATDNWTEYGIVHLRFDRPLNPHARDPWKQEALLPCG